jgi:UDP-N-acetylmuramoylalanine--D-glutamate ligase
LIGETADEFYDIFDGFNRAKAMSLSDAAEKALKMTSEGDNIILSPACASFDMFQSYEHRGDEFRKIFERLSSGHE